MNIDAYSRIKSTANDLFIKYGLKSVSVADIASTLQISKKTFYLSFTNKDELITQLADESFDELRSTWRKTETRYQGLEQYLWKQYSLLCWLEQTNQSLWYDVEKYYPGILERYRNFKDEFIIPNLIAVLSQARNWNMLIEKTNVRLFCQLQVNNMEEIFRSNWTFVHEYERMDLFEQMVYNSLKGILNNSYQARFELESFRAGVSV